MNLQGTAALFAVMISLAAVPSSSVALVIAPTAAQGLPSGLAAASGIVRGPGLRIAAAAYLVWFCRVACALLVTAGAYPATSVVAH